MIIRIAYTLVSHHFAPLNAARINLIRIKLTGDTAAYYAQNKLPINLRELVPFQADY